MGRHSSSDIAARQGFFSGVTGVGSAKYVGRVGALAVALGVGAAVAGGAGLANAEGPADNGASATVATDGSPGVASPKSRILRVSKTHGVSGASTGRGRDGATSGVSSRNTRQGMAPEAGGATGNSPTRVRKAPKRSIRPNVPAATARTVPAPNDPPTDDLPTATGGANQLGVGPSANTGGSPVAPTPVVLGALQLISREIDHLVAKHSSPTASFTTTVANVDPAVTTEAPNPADEALTDYGNIGKWMLEPNGQISDYGGQLYDGRTLLEPINVIIVDPTSKTKWAATRKLNAAMLWSGFPPRPIHTNGFRGRIDDVTYGQLPRGFLQGFSDNSFLVTNDHGRVFGPDPVETNTGFVWSASFGTEDFGTYDSRPAHLYVSSETARTALASSLVRSGRATVVGMVPLGNSYNTDTITTGDHDGYAVVLQLT